MASPIWLENEPSALNTNLSSNRQGRPSRPAPLAAVVANHSLLPASGPTPAAPSPSSFQMPTSVISSGSTQPSAQYSTALLSVVAVPDAPSLPLISKKLIVKVTPPSRSCSVILRTAVQAPTLPVTSAAKPPMVTSGFIRASLASKDNLISSPNLAVPNLEAFLDLLCLIDTLRSVGATPSGLTGSARLLSVTELPPPPQAVRIKDRDSAKIAPK